MNEDFITYELAVKLKEKGFDWQTFDWYDMAGNFCKGFMPRELMCREYYAPTISQVLKWLREEKKIVICIFPHSCGWQADIYKDVHQYYDSEAECYLMHYYKEKTEISHSYNWLEIYCIRYVLDNLV